MNPLASSKYALRVLMSLAAIMGIFLMAGCSSSGPVTPNNQGFSNSSLNGTYVFSSQGYDASGDPLALAGAFVANGSGSITGGTIDVIDPGFTSIPATAAQSIKGGSYSISSDGRGQVALQSTYPTFNLDFALSSTSHGLVTEFDSNGTGSGTLDLQTALTGISQLAGPYALGLAGTDNSGNPLITAGSFTFNAGGGIQDFNDNGIPYTARPLSNSATLGTGTGPGEASFSTAFGTLAFDFYPIDATHLKFIETDYTNAYLAGDVFTQTGASIPAGTLVFTMFGGTSTTVVADGGIMTSDANGNITDGLEDVNDNGTVPGAQVPFTGIAGASGVGGRVAVTLSGFVPAEEWAMYPTASGGLLLLELDTQSATLGSAFAQSATTFASSEGYGLNLSGINSNGPVGYIAQFNSASSDTATPNMTGILDDSEFATPIANIPLSATYTSVGAGRGSITAPTTGNLGTFLGELNLVYYVIDGSNMLFVDLDSSNTPAGPQVAVGTFEQQSSTAPGVVAHVAHRAISTSTARPLVGSHATRGDFRRR
ncbi:MAG: hypothetical protein WBW53_04270 [Terriglobales bacterium]